jgi:hypothetical protein
MKIKLFLKPLKTFFFLRKNGISSRFEINKHDCGNITVYSFLRAEIDIKQYLCTSF